MQDQEPEVTGQAPKTGSEVETQPMKPSPESLESEVAKPETIVSEPSQGYIHAYWAQAKSVLLHPRSFFETMPPSVSMKEPFVFLAISALIYAFLQALVKFNFLILFTAFFTTLVTVSVGAMVAFYAFKKLGGKGTMLDTFRVFSYSKATLLFAWFAAGPYAIGGWLALVYSIYLNIIGCMKVHGLPKKITSLLIIILAILGMLLRARMP